MVLVLIPVYCTKQVKFFESFFYTEDTLQERTTYIASKKILKSLYLDIK